MTQQHPITPPQELIEQWVDEYIHTKPDCTAPQLVAARSAQWGADQELEACCEWLEQQTLCGHQDLLPSFRAARRPKPPSLKEQALEIVRKTPVNSAALYSYEHVEIIRRALEQLND